MNVIYNINPTPFCIVLYCIPWFRVFEGVGPFRNILSVLSSHREPPLVSTNNSDCKYTSLSFLSTLQAVYYGFPCDSVFFCCTLPAIVKL